ncbi:MAG: FAD-dependent oxidoreductase [Nitrospirae bacterium]|nr:FAD-dependent oxidoreductase [Nitrospirota bacterium]
MPDEPEPKDKPVTRRRFLKRAGVAAGVVAAGGIAAVPLSRNRRLDAMYPSAPANRVDLKPNGKTVLIVGGGLSGLQAGVELSMRGFKVVVLEKSGTPGGKLKSWRDKQFGPPDDPYKREPGFKGYVREHGVHAVWGFYNNLREFMGRYGWKLQELPDSLSIYTFLDKDGRRSSIPNSKWPAPYDWLEQGIYASRINYGGREDRRRLPKAFLKMASFEYADPKQREYLDGMTLEEYGQKLGLSREIVWKLFDSMVEMAYFDNVDRTSALTVANLIQLVRGSSEDLKINLFLNPPGETFLQPMVDLIRSKGGQVHFNTQVTDIEIEGGRVRRVTAGALPGGRVRRCAICGELIFGDYEYGECPFCGARADRLQELSAEEKSERSFEGDYVVVALDVPAAQSWVRSNLAKLGDQPYFQNILGLHATHVYVVNMWFEGTKFWMDKIVNGEGEPVPDFFATGFDRLGITLNWTFPLKMADGTHRWLMKEFEGRDVSVIETQIANAESVSHLTNEEIARQCYEELKGVMPGIPPYRSYYVNRWGHYTAYHVGDERKRPPIQSPIENLLFIGDMVFVPHPAVFMEKTNVTAKWAVNLLLEKIGQSQGRIEILPSGTPTRWIPFLQSLTSVYV